LNVFYIIYIIFALLFVVNTW